MATKVKAKTVKAARRGRTSTSRLSSKNQVTVPVAILREAGLVAGDIVKFEVNAGVIVIKVQENVEHPLEALIGAGKGVYQGFDLAKERGLMWPK